MQKCRFSGAEIRALTDRRASDQTSMFTQYTLWSKTPYTVALNTRHIVVLHEQFIHIHCEYHCYVTFYNVFPRMQALRTAVCPYLHTF